MHCVRPLQAQAFRCMGWRPYLLCLIEKDSDYVDKPVMRECKQTKQGQEQTSWKKDVKQPAGQCQGRQIDCICIPPHDLSSDYVNELSSSKLDPDHGAEFKGYQRCEVLVPKNGVHNEAFRQTDNRGRNAAPLEPCGPHQGLFPRGHTGCGHSVNPEHSNKEIGPRTSPQSLRNPQVGSWGSTVQGIHTFLDLLEVRNSRSQDHVLPSLEETPAMGKGECRAPAEAQSPVWEGQDQDLPLPGWDHPPLWDLAVDSHGDYGKRKKRWWKPFHS
ncbi:hypothetical protein H920_04559 [Fukomys damarensis]|uniref:Uncharacterized protein n=1 Tax=Fukomys damarensis TaxID=885580 RepID=A0A091EF65_FUKDA|nr:hypothetical protein H920_04559 [Fukomys damarensis]